MDEDCTRETQPGDENMQITNIVSRDHSRQAILKKTNFSQKQEKLMEKVFAHIDKFQSKQCNLNHTESVQ